MVVSPELVSFLLHIAGAVSFCPGSCRQASLKLRVLGGKMEICSLYTPHSGKPFDEMQTLFQAAADWMNSLFRHIRHGPLLALGDFNARLHKMHAGESHFIGPHIFGNKNAYFNAESNNRSLLLEMCESLGLFVANTGLDLPVEKQVTLTVSEQLRYMLDKLVTSLGKVGLQLNAAKTKALTTQAQSSATTEDIDDPRWFGDCSVGPFVVP